MKGDKRHKDGSSLNHRILHNKIQIKPNHKNWRQKRLKKKRNKKREKGLEGESKVAVAGQ